MNLLHVSSAIEFTCRRILKIIFSCFNLSIDIWNTIVIVWKIINSNNNNNIKKDMQTN